MATTQNRLSAELRDLVGRLENRNSGTTERDKAGFIAYATTQSAKPITEKTAKEYVRWLGKEYVLNVAKAVIPGDYSSVFDINDIEALERVCVVLIQDESNFQAYKGFPSASVGKYIDYLKYLAETTEQEVSPFIRNDIQKIVYGCPGSGKSWKVKNVDTTDSNYVFRTTFHPDTDYASFVGTYKPIKKSDSITYEFVSQVFTDAYIAAWSHPTVKVYLVIEEINRGNCAQIFGDIFQLLDRDEKGFSEYSIKADHDLRDHLIEVLGETSEGIKQGELRLPPNLGIIATMNTSDQSLFPMDSAFKRRWQWEYVPIRFDNEKSTGYKITIGKRVYIWHDFVKLINGRVYDTTRSEDKQLGTFFIHGSVDEKEFKSKVMFYLWSEICKEEAGTDNNFFRVKDGNKEFTFNDLYSDKGQKILIGFFDYLDLKYEMLPNSDSEEIEDETIL
jgi:hypothetical protein